MFRIVAFIHLVAFFLVACESKFEKECNLDNIFECGAVHLADSVVIVEGLVGQWKWQFDLNCANFVVDDPGDNTAYAGLVIELRADGTGQYTRNNNTGRFRWKITRTGRAFEIDDADDTSLVTDPPHITMLGIIYLCDDTLLMSRRGVDGYDNLFIRL